MEKGGKYNTKSGRESALRIWKALDRFVISIPPLFIQTYSIATTSYLLYFKTPKQVFFLTYINTFEHLLHS